MNLLALFPTILINHKIQNIFWSIQVKKKKKIFQNLNNFLPETAASNSYESNYHQNKLNQISNPIDNIEPPLQNDDDSGEQHKNYIIPILVAIIAVVTGCLFILFSRFYLTKEPTNIKTSLETTMLLKILKTEFPSQKSGFYTNIISCYQNSILNGKDPSIIMLVASRKDKNNLGCVARKLLKTLNEAIIGQQGVNYKYLIIDTKKLVGKQHDDAKLVLDEDLTKIFTNLNAKIALVEDIQNIPAQSMLIFHTFGDDETTTKYKGIITLLTFEIDEDISETKDRYAELSDFVERKLSEKWSKDIKYDQLKPLYARIANNIVLINNQETC
jgi:hypothetical protein